MKSYDANKPTTVKDLEEMAVMIINSIKEVVATKEDVKKVEKKVDKLEEKVDNISYDVSDIKRRVIDLETDRIGRQEFIKLKQKILND